MKVFLGILFMTVGCHASHHAYDQLCLKENKGYLRHPHDCGKFIRCSHQIAYEFQCPSNLLWHHEIKSCDYSYRTPCKLNEYHNEKSGGKKKRKESESSQIIENVKVKRKKIEETADYMKHRVKYTITEIKLTDIPLKLLATDDVKKTSTFYNTDKFTKSVKETTIENFAQILTTDSLTKLEALTSFPKLLNSGFKNEAHEENKSDNNAVEVNNQDNSTFQGTTEVNSVNLTQQNINSIKLTAATIVPVMFWGNTKNTLRTSALPTIENITVQTTAAEEELKMLTTSVRPAAYNRTLTTEVELTVQGNFVNITEPDYFTENKQEDKANSVAVTQYKVNRSETTTNILSLTDTPTAKRNILNSPPENTSVYQNNMIEIVFGVTETINDFNLKEPTLADYSVGSKKLQEKVNKENLEEITTAVPITKQKVIQNSANYFSLNEKIIEDPAINLTDAKITDYLESLNTMGNVNDYNVTLKLDILQSSTNSIYTTENNGIEALDDTTGNISDSAIQQTTRIIANQMESTKYTTAPIELHNNFKNMSMENLTDLSSRRLLKNQTQTTTALPTTLYNYQTYDSTTQDPRLPFRSIECQGPNNRIQFKANKCYQYYQCFAGWAFLLNCREGWRFQAYEQQCVLDINQQCV